MCQAAPPPGGHLEVSQVRLEGAVVASAKHGQGWGFCFLRELTFRFLCPFYLYFIKKANWEQGCTGGHWRVEGVHGTRYSDGMFFSTQHSGYFGQTRVASGTTSKTSHIIEKGKTCRGEDCAQSFRRYCFGGWVPAHAEAAGGGVKATDTVYVYNYNCGCT